MLPHLNNRIYFLLLLISTVTCDVDLKLATVKLSEDINNFKLEQLGVSFIGKMCKNFNYMKNCTIATSKTEETMANLWKITNKIETKINNIFSAMDQTESLMAKHVELLNFNLYPCMNGTSDELKMPLDTNNFRYFGAQHNLHHIKENGVKQFYFVPLKRIENIQQSPFSKCTGINEDVIWKNVNFFNKYTRKNVIILLDHGGNLNFKQLHLAKETAKTILTYLTDKDRVSFISLASEWSFIVSNHSHNTCNCSGIHYGSGLQNATNQHLLMISNYIDSLVKSNGATNHIAGIEKAFEILKQTMTINHTNDTVIFVYISCDIRSAGNVREMIYSRTRNFTFPFYMHTCAIGDEPAVTYESSDFLSDISNRDLNTTSISNCGYMLHINKTETIPFVVYKIFSVFINSTSVDKHISLPHWNTHSQDFTISLTKITNLNQQFVLFGTDMYFSNLAEDLVYYSSNQQYIYAFLIDLNGNVLVHPAILRPSIVNHQLKFVDIEFYENVNGIGELRTKLLTHFNGSYVTKNLNGEMMQYVWRRIMKWYVVCFVLNKNYDGSFNVPYKAVPNYFSIKNFLYYYKTDDSQPYKFCKHIDQIATLDVASLYLSSSCFNSPFSVARTTQANLIDQGYLAYLKDNTMLLANPGLKSHVRDEVLALSHILDYLRKKHLSSTTMSKYIVRRYVSSYSGVLQMFPGSILQWPGFEITKRPWFLRALQHPNKVVFIPPYLDRGGAGYIVTVAYATSNFISALDLTHGYILKMILKHMPYCLKEKITCFVIDDQGYIIYHPNLMDVKIGMTKHQTIVPIEQQHIFHKESLIANDMLINRKDFIKKLFCNNFADGTIQRYYRLNTSYHSKSGDHQHHHHHHGISAYSINTINDTNIFIGLINASTSKMSTTATLFCPCNVIDRLCFNCNRMELNDCECPCECPLKFERNITNNSLCKWYAEEKSLDPVFMLVDDIKNTSTLNGNCFSIDCRDEESHLDCLGVIGCEWCRYDLNGDFLQQPFCTSLAQCYNGIYGASPPYKNNFSTYMLPSNYSQYSTVIGPILALILAMIVLFIILYMCCYRWSSSNYSTVDRLYLSSNQDQLRMMSDINVNEMYHYTDSSGNRNGKLLKDDCLQPLADTLSPYCVVSNNYKANGTAIDSDYGYSTMTPHDESEHLSLAPIEVQSIDDDDDDDDDDLLSDSFSIYTKGSTNKKLYGISPMLFPKMPPRNNCVVVPVTVHRNID